MRCVSASVSSTFGLGSSFGFGSRVSRRATLPFGGGAFAGIANIMSSSEYRSMGRWAISSIRLATAEESLATCRRLGAAELAIERLAIDPEDARGSRTIAAAGRKNIHHMLVNDRLEIA